MSKKIAVSIIPGLMKFWDYEKNILNPNDVGKRSDTKVWWICPNGHDSYLQSPRQKLRNKVGCPKCAVNNRIKVNNERLLKDKGSIVETHPQLVKEWDYDKNIIEPNKVLAGTHTKYWWKCPKCGNSYYMSPNMRVSKNRNCPSCGIDIRGKNKRSNLLKKYGSLFDTHPELAKEWDNYNNIDTPKDVHKNMAEKRYWVCQYGHGSYKQVIRDRVRRYSGCPICHGEYQTSFPEQVIYYYFKRRYSSTINRYIKDNKEIDIYIPELNIGIEYDGSFWHKDKIEIEKQKDDYFFRNNIRILHIKESKTNVKIINNNIYIKPTSNYDYLVDVLKILSEMLNIDLEPIDLNKDKQIIWDSYLLDKQDNSLEVRFPEIAREWDSEKNIIAPSKVSPFSRKKVFWICSKCNNSFQMVIGDRTGNKKCGCPKCGLKKKQEKSDQKKKLIIDRISEYKNSNKDATIVDCSRKLGLSYPTVKKYWNYN